MKLESGKKYRDGLGRRVDILITDLNHPDFPCLGILHTEHGEVPETYKSDGHVLKQMNDDNGDIVAELPPWEVGKTYKTRGGKAATILAIDLWGAPIAAVVWSNEHYTCAVNRYGFDGRFQQWCGSHSLDLTYEECEKPTKPLVEKDGEPL